jgi:hypothetical protein
MVGPSTPLPPLLRCRHGLVIRLQRHVLLLLVVMLLGCQATQEPLSDLGGVGELQARFNRDSGKTRIVLLLSPT